MKLQKIDIFTFQAFQLSLLSCSNLKTRSHQHECQGDGVENEVSGLVVGVEAGQEEENDWDDGQELPGRRVLKAVIKLLPVGQTTNGACNDNKNSRNTEYRNYIYNFC